MRSNINRDKRQQRRGRVREKKKRVTRTWDSLDVDRKSLRNDSLVTNSRGDFTIASPVVISGGSCRLKGTLERQIH